MNDKKDDKTPKDDKLEREIDQLRKDVLDELRTHRLLMADVLIAVRGYAQRDQQQERVMAKKLEEYVADFNAKLATLTSEVAEQTTLSESISTLVTGVIGALQGQSAQIASLKQQVIDAINAGGDPSVLQPLVDGLDTQLALLDANGVALQAKADELAAAIPANT